MAKGRGTPEEPAAEAAGAAARDEGAGDAGPDDGPAPQEAPEPRGPGAEDEALDDDLDALSGDVRDLSALVGDLTERLARARADYENLQRRVERDAALERERVRARVLEGFLQVFEYGRLAAAEAEKHPGSLADGVKMVVREFERLLEREGVFVLGAPGEPFDPTRHEAVAAEPADGVEAGHVSRVVAPGYLLGDRVLRFAKVAVAPGP